MKRPHIKACLGVLLLLVLFLGAPQPVQAEEDEPKYPVWAYTISKITDKVCLGRTVTIRLVYGYQWQPSPRGAPPRPAPLVFDIDGHASAQNGIIRGLSKENDTNFRDIGIIPGAKYIRKFTYTAKELGKGQINIKVELSPYEVKKSISFEVKECAASLQFNQNTTLSYAAVTLINNYSGGGSLRADNDGRITGSGAQSIWSDIPPYTIEGATCTHQPPWEGSSGITFTGQMGENGENNVMMAMESLSINTSTLTCTGEGSGGMTFPGYTYSSCEVPLTGFDFEATTLDVLFDCSGEAPYTVPITIIPREKQ